MKIKIDSAAVSTLSLEDARKNYILLFNFRSVMVR